MGVFWSATWDLLTRGAAALGGFLRGIHQADNPGLTALAVLMVADYVTGVLAAALCRSRKTPGGGLSSRAGWQGLLRKGLTLLVVALAHLLDSLTGQGAMFESAATWFYISNEALSVLENLTLCGVPTPAFLRRALESLRESKSETARDKEEEKKTENAPKPKRRFRRPRRFD